ncbi:hypothetical protein [Streptosporangium sp. NPDC051022]|uniref:hypothetical protein n=1 Tax=Streptosporangium sp. NPDC051022 TaxID=3155752 RepID=UPI0034137546
MSTLPDGLEPIDPLTWRTIVARCLLGSTVKLVALTAANYASPNGADVRPGVALLMKDTELGERTVRDALGRLRELGLVWRTFEGSSAGTTGLTDEYQLTYPDDLESRVAMWDPKRQKITRGGVEQAPPTPHIRRKKKAPASPAGGSPVDNSVPPAGDAGGTPSQNHHKSDTDMGLPSGNHRHLTAEPPATHNGTTGNSCTPPSHSPSHRPSHDSGFSPYGAEVEGEGAGRREPSAKSSAASFRQSPILTVLPAPGPDPAEYDRARDVLARLPDLGSALMARARDELGADAPRAQLVIHAAALATRRTA